MFEILHKLSDSDLLSAVYWLGHRLNIRNEYSDADHHRRLANDPDLTRGSVTLCVQEAIAQVLEEIEAAEGKPIHAMTAAQVSPYLRRMYDIHDQRKEPSTPESTADALRILEEMRRDYANPSLRNPWISQALEHRDPQSEVGRD